VGEAKERGQPLCSCSNVLVWFGSRANPGPLDDRSKWKLIYGAKFRKTVGNITREILKPSFNIFHVYLKKNLDFCVTFLLYNLKHTHKSCGHTTLLNINKICASTESYESMYLLLPVRGHAPRRRSLCTSPASIKQFAKQLFLRNLNGQTFPVIN